MFGFDDSAFKKSTASIFVALLVFGFVPIIGLIRVVPLFKEILLGAAVVVIFTGIADTKRAIKFALVSGMIAAVLFNVAYIPLSTILGGLAGMGMEGGSADAAGGMALLSGLGALANLFGLIFFSPIGYILGGALGSVLNQ